jgi:formylglycine-generating enzyme required for sulfatase activity
MSSLYTQNANDLARIPGGTFLMGSPDSESGRWDDEGPQHSVTVNVFYMGKYEVTVGEFQRFVNAAGYKTLAETSGGGYVWTGSQLEQKADANWKNPYFSQGESQPVVLVSWYDAVEYCNWRSREEGLAAAYTRNGDTVTWDRGANGYRLPTEAEWEYACRAGTTTPFSTGNNITTSQGNYNSSKTKNVGSYSANPWGLYDMHGNVFEWCWDWHGDYSGGAAADPAGASPDMFRIGRGGGWYYYDALHLRSASRQRNTPSNRCSGLGFRVVRP